MDIFLWINAVAFVAVVAYGIYLFAYVVATRFKYIKMGKKQEFDLALKERINNVWKIVFGQSKLLKDIRLIFIGTLM